MKRRGFLKLLASAAGIIAMPSEVLTWEPRPLVVVPDTQQFSMTERLATFESKLARLARQFREGMIGSEPGFDWYVNKFVTQDVMYREAMELFARNANMVKRVNRRYDNDGKGASGEHISIRLPQRYR